MGGMSWFPGELLAVSDTTLNSSYIKRVDDLFFLKHINKYNDLGEFYNHYVKFNDDVMVIMWEHNKWDYHVYLLEE